ncbi:MAG: 3-oxoacyl-[acyl-carrier-protein] synthase III C-terminal domain-containing protein, partial [Bacilli bacterium]
ALLFVSTTGIATPSIDTYIAQKLHLSQHIKRTPIWGLGCAGGTGGVGRAFEWAKANPTSRILLVTVELCGLTFIRNDMSKSNLVATSLFADGAAAVLISGDDLPESPYKVTPRIIDSMSTLWKDSYGVMGWNVTEQGLKVVFSKDIPTIVHQYMRPNVDHFLSKHDLTVDKINHLITHPGGEKVIQAYAESLSLPRDRFGIATDILRRYGNMSSVTVLFVLDQVLKCTPNPHEYGLMTSLGPGFCSELVLLQW